MVAKVRKGIYLCCECTPNSWCGAEANQIVSFSALQSQSYSSPAI